MSRVSVLQEDCRGLTLSALDEAGGHRLPETSLKSILDGFGYRLSTDEMRAILAWLEAQGLVRLDKSGTWIVQLLDAGQDVAGGVAHPGVRRQAPKR